LRPMRMPRLSKDEIKKYVLSLLGLIVLLYCYSTFLLRPLNQARARMITAMADREKNLAEGKKTLQQAAQLEETAGNSVERSTTLDHLTPAGAPVAWFPPLMKSFFAADQIEIGHVRLLNTTALKESELATYSKMDWIIDIPHTDFLLLGLSIARLENKRVLSSITGIQIHTVQDRPEFQSVTLGIAMILKK
jgi:hypothetical protein